MLNSNFSLEQADYFSERVLRSTAAYESAALVRRAFQLALCRDPEEAELNWSTQFLGMNGEEKLKATAGVRQKLAQLCHALLNTNEFLYIH